MLQNTHRSRPNSELKKEHYKDDDTFFLAAAALAAALQPRVSARLGLRSW